MSLCPKGLFQQLPKHRPLWLALSGGLDSMVLLHLMVKAGLSFKAIHVNHQLSPNAHSWQVQCQTVCDALGVELVVKQVRVVKQGRGLEDAARQARYQAFSDVLSPEDCLLMAHHRDDQAETLLLRLMRGAGVKGLSGMSALMPLAFEGEVRALLYRPLLHITRQALAAWAQAQQLVWVDDESNQDCNLDRNFLRHKVLPMLEARWPSFAKRWVFTAEHLGEAADLLDEVAEGDLAAYVQSPLPERIGASLGLGFLTALSAARSKNLLRYWLAQQGVALDTARLADLMQQLKDAKPDAKIEVQVNSLRLHRYQGRLYCLTSLQFPPLAPLEIRPGQPVSFGSGQVLMQRAKAGVALPACGYWTLRTRRDGERCQPKGRPHSQSLKKLLQEAQLPPWLRDQLPLLCDGEVLLAAGDLWLEAQAELTDFDGYQLVWSFPKNTP